MAEWLYEDGIGENRAALVDGGTIIEAAIELDETAPLVGAVMAARLGPPVPPSSALARLEDGEALVSPVPRGIGEGGHILVEIVREAIPEPGNPKLPLARPATDDAVPRAAPRLLERIGATGLPVHRLRTGDPDRLEQSGWSELLDEAASGQIAFAGGRLRLSLTPAMALFDVDGALAPLPLAIAGAGAAGRAIRRLGIGGSIGIDLPTLASKADRQAAAAAFDAVLPQPFERTAVNGFGFLQIVRRRERPSIPEQLRADRTGAAARALLRAAEHSRGIGARTLVAAPTLVDRITARPEWVERLARSLGAPVMLRAEASLAISAGYVAVEHP
ncbi:MAG: ribonuclease [Sphingomonadaceae bacterium]|nr:ribonuclease [Sphingomonadaceae bacterium]